MAWTNPLTYGVLLAAATTVDAVAWRIFWWVARIDPLPEGLRKLTCTIQKDTTEIRADIKRILLLLTPVVDRGSPIKLNEFGRQIAERLHAGDWAGTIAPTLSATVLDQQDFEIDEFAAEIVENLGDDWPTRIATTAYENGIDRESVKTVLRVVLRDELIKVRNTPPA